MNDDLQRRVDKTWRYKSCKVEGSKLNEFGSVRLELRLYNDKTIVSYTIHNNNIGGGGDFISPWHIKSFHKVRLYPL